MFLVVSIAILDMHSSVNVAECGLNKTLLFFNKGLSKLIGSFTNTSNAAPKIRFSFNALSIDKALNENLILGAALDVFVNEPINLDNPLLKNNKVLLSPHSATFTDECISRMAIETTKNIIDFFENKIDKSMIVKL